MKKRNFLPLFLLLSLSLAAEESSDTNMAHVSEAFGHLIHRNFTLLNVPFDVAKIIQGIEEAAEGKKALITEEECIEAIHSEQGKKFKLLCSENLKKAEDILASNAKEEGVVCLAEGKVQYRIVSPGKGAEVKDHSCPLLRFSVKADGTDILPPNKEETVSLDETIDGLKAGLIGMKQGEKRVLYLHPSLAYGEKGLSTLYPNVLLTFDVEVLKAIPKKPQDLTTR